MPRKPRIFLDGGYYHLIARGNNRMPLFRLKGGFEVFKELLKESKFKFPWKLSHYCLMTNHLHFLGQLEHGNDLPKLMQYLLFGYSRWFRKKTKYMGHVWQGRYKSPLIESESYFLECGRYIERNPLRAGMVLRAEDYRWSSYHYYSFGKKDELVDEDPYYASLGTTSAERQEYYRNFIKLEGPYDKIIDRCLLEKYF